MSFRMLTQAVLATAAKDLIVSRPNQTTVVQSIRIVNNSTNTASITIYHPFLNQATAATNLIYPAVRMAGNTTLIDDTPIPLNNGERLVAFGSTTNLSVTIYGNGEAF